MFKMNFVELILNYILVCLIAELRCFIVGICVVEVAEESHFQEVLGVNTSSAFVFSSSSLRRFLFCSSSSPSFLLAYLIYVGFIWTWFIRFEIYNDARCWTWQMERVINPRYSWNINFFRPNFADWSRQTSADLLEIFFRFFQMNEMLKKLDSAAF